MISCVAWLPLTETKLRFKNDALQAVDLRGESGFSCRREAVEAAVVALGSAGTGCIDHQLLIHELLQVVVQGAGADPIASLGLACDLLNDAVTMQVFAGKSEKNVKGCGGKRWRRSFRAVPK
jgi:hypothetical protein